MPTPKPRLDSLTGLRLFLALFVFFHHGMEQAHLGTGAGSLPPAFFHVLERMCDGGFAVGGFFVLSGFVMWYTYADRNWTLAQFLGNRVARLYPVYVLGILIVLLRWNKLLPQFNLDTSDGLFQLARSLLMIQAWSYDWDSSQIFNGPGWTLSVEMFFYVTFPLIFWIGRKSRPWMRGCCLAITLATLMAPPVGFEHHLPICVRHWGLFTLGILTCDLWKSGITCRIPPWCVALILFSACQLSWFLDMHWVTYMAPPFMMLILASMDLGDGGSSIFSNRYSVLGGEISYAIYILHVPIQTIVYSLFYRCGIFLLHCDSLWLKSGYLFASLLVTIAASYLSWRYIEVPMKSLIGGFLRKTAA